jgi:hypothetical protein
MPIGLLRYRAAVAIAGPVVCGLLIGAVALWALGVAVPAAAAGVAAFAIGAATAGADSRSRGDWTTAPRR